ncbi:MAG TPA: serine/threonine-protein kinase [Anaerolineales bacterium]|nr:serine/threonine-protein kinase [Anaerolineales bacterium]
MFQTAGKNTSLNNAVQFASRYRLEEEISRGPTASIYRAADLEDDRPVAIKVFQERYQSDPRFSIRFREHLRLLSGLKHDNLISILDYGVDQGAYYIVMEWVEGVDLATYIAEYAPLPAGVVAFVARQVCAALDAVHQAAFIHRGVKPENILINMDGQVKVTGAGLSGLLSESGLSKTHVMIGGVGYISPEQARGKSLGPSSDIYSLGVVVFEMLSGRLPFESNDVWSLVRMHAREKPPDLRGLNPKVPAALAEITERALEKVPEDRFSSAAGMGAALSALEDEFGEGTLVARRSGRGSIPAGLYQMLRELAAPGVLRDLLLRPFRWQVAGREVPVWAVLAFQFVLAFLITFVALYLLSLLIGG